MKRSVMALLLVLMLGITGCSSGNSSSASASKDASTEAAATTKEAGGKEVAAETKEEKVANGDAKLNVWIAGSGEAEYDAAYREIFDKFAEENGVSYELTFIPWSDYFTKLNTGLIGGAGPDVYMLGYGQMGSVLDLGYVQNLDEYIPENWDGLEDIAPNVLDAGKSDGSLYALFSPSVRVWMYRKDIARQQGVTEEDLTLETPEDFYDLIRKLTVRDEKGNVVTYGLELDQDAEQFFYSLASMYQKDRVLLWNDDMTAGFNTLLIGNYMVVNSESKNKELAAEMLFDLYSGESCSILAKKASLYSGRKSLDKEFLSINPEFGNVLSAYGYSTTFAKTLNPKFNELIADFRLGLEQVYAQDDTTGQLKSMEEAWNSKAAE